MATIAKNKEEPYYPDGGYGWVIVGAVILINVSLLTFVPCFGVIFAEEFKQWGVTKAETSFLLHLHSSLYCTFGFFTSPFLTLYGMKPVALVGATLMCLGIFLSSFANSYIYFIFSTSVLIGLGQGIVMPATYLATYSYFKKRLTAALSLTVTSASLSSIVVAITCDRLLSLVGRTYTVLLLFAVSLLSYIGCFLLKPVKRKPTQEEEKCLEEMNNITPEEATKQLISEDQKTFDSVYKDTTVEKKKNSIFVKLFNVFDLHLLQNVPLVVMIVGLGISFSAELNLILMLQFMLGELSHFERSDIAIAVSIQSGADIVGRLLIPMCAHYFGAPPKLMYAGALVVATVARTVLATWPTDKLVVWGVVTVIGLTKGTRAVFQSVVLPKYVSLDKVAAANGINMLFTGFVSLAMGPVIGWIQDVSGSPLYPLHAASILSMSCVLMWILEYIFWEKKTESSIS